MLWKWSTRRSSQLDVSYQRIQVVVASDTPEQTTHNVGAQRNNDGRRKGQWRQHEQPLRGITPHLKEHNGAKKKEEKKGWWVSADISHAGTTWIGFCHHSTACLFNRREIERKLPKFLGLVCKWIFFFFSFHTLNVENQTCCFLINHLPHVHSCVRSRHSSLSKKMLMIRKKTKKLDLCRVQVICNVKQIRTVKDAVWCVHQTKAQIQFEWRFPNNVWQLSFEDLQQYASNLPSGSCHTYSSRNHLMNAAWSAIGLFWSCRNKNELKFNWGGPSASGRTFSGVLICWILWIWTSVSSVSESGKGIE